MDGHQSLQLQISVTFSVPLPNMRGCRLVVVGGGGGGGGGVCVCVCGGGGVPGPVHNYSIC